MWSKQRIFQVIYLIKMSFLLLVDCVCCMLSERMNRDLVCFSREMAKLPVKLTDPVTPILYITDNKRHIQELKLAIHVREIVEGWNYLNCFRFFFCLIMENSQSFTIGNLFVI
jgi:hypothetical protein